MSLWLKGRPSMWKGKTNEERYGKVKADKIKKKCSLAGKGRIPWNKNKPWSEEKHSIQDWMDELLNY